MNRALVAVIVLAVGINAIQFEDCGSQYDLRTVNIQGCINAPCRIKIGTSVNVTTTFVAYFDSHQLDDAVYFLLMDIQNDAVVKQHTCAGTSSGCAMSSVTPLSYTAELYVDAELPPVPGFLVWRIKNEDLRIVVCFRVQVQLYE